MKIFAYIRTTISYICFLLAGLICFFPCFFIALLPTKYRYDSKIYYWFSDFFFKSVLTFSFLPVKITGKKNLPDNHPVILAGNHQSALDIAVMAALCRGHPQIWLALEYYEKTFILGFFIRRMNVSVDQAKPLQAAKSLNKAINLVKGKNRHLVIFPEGRRIRDYTVSSFMKGFAVAARVTKRPIIPVYMPNNYKIYPPGSFLINYYPLIINIGPEFSYQEDDTDKSFMERVHQWFVQQSQEYKK